MSRLIDLFPDQRWRQSMQNAPVIKIDNVVEYWYHSPLCGSARDFPCIAPPFPLFSMEWENVNNSELDGAIKAVIRRAGVVVASENYQQQENSYRWLMTIMMMWERRDGRPAFCPFGWQIRVTTDGQAEEGNGQIIANLYAGDTPISEKQRNLAVGLVEGGIFPALLAMSFMHCKNVEVIEQRPPRTERRRAERTGTAALTHYTLQIDPMKKILRTEGQSETVGLKRALSICRGHFADYTQGKGLFGKHKGVFWVPQHMKGSAQYGVIEKDYAVTAPHPKNGRP